MYSKFLIWLGLFIGSTVGGFVPTLWGADIFSFSAVLCSGAGGFLGIWAGVKLSDYIDI